MDAPAALNYIINHVFLPIEVHQRDDWSQENDYKLCSEVLEAVRAYRNRHAHRDEKHGWYLIIRMLERLQSLNEEQSFSREKLIGTLEKMIAGDVAAIFVRAQNAALIVRKFADRTVFESFEVTLPMETITNTIGKLVCMFPATSIALPSDVASNRSFLTELSNFVSRMNVDSIPDATPPPTTSRQIPDSPHPKYISELLTGILRGMGQPEDGSRIRKRIGDEVLMRLNNTSNIRPWRRSALWTVIRVALQTTLVQGVENHTRYKRFMIFLMGRILQKATRSGGCDSDLFSTMQKKVARRLLKLSNASTAPLVLAENDSVVSFVEETIKLTEQKLNTRWTYVQERHSKSAGSNVDWDPDRLDIHDDTRMSLPHSHLYIEEEWHHHRHPTQASPITFRPNEKRRRRTLVDFEDPRSLLGMKDVGGILIDFERAVEVELEEWVSSRLSSPPAESFVVVSRWITDYASKARSLYAGEPENLSVMFLTLLDLWIGLDRTCTSQCTLLLEYSPEIPESLFEPLLLRRGVSITRLETAILYLRTRHSRVNMDYPSIFSREITSTSFAVKYFNLPSSSSYRDLKRDIETEAHQDRQSKLVELQGLNARFEHLMAQSNALQCSHRTRYRHNDITGREESGVAHSSSCEKCRLRQEAEALDIPVFEWPLPSDTSEAKGVVVELDPPKVLRVWRDTTYLLVHNQFLQSRVFRRASPRCVIAEYQGTQDFVRSSRIGDLTLASRTASVYQLKSWSVRIPSQEAKVCVANRLKYRLYAKSNEHWASDETFRMMLDGATLRSICTFQLPPGKYKDSGLQKTIEGVEYGSNMVIARQVDCHKELNIHEFIAFGSLRAGQLLQWLNILRELAAGMMTFSEQAVESLFRLAHTQTGPLSPLGVGWVRHKEPEDSEFHLEVLRALTSLLESIQGNWAEMATMRLIVMLATASLERPPTTLKDVVEEAVFRLIGSARNVAVRWMEQLNERLKEAEGEKDTQEFKRRLWEAAATCRMTFHSFLDPANPAYYLKLTEDDKTIWFSAGIIAHDNRPMQPSSSSPMLANLFFMDQRFARLSANTLRANSSGLSKAIKDIWPFFEQSGGWTALPEPNDCWMTCRSGDSLRNNRQAIHFNLITGQLLVDGKPLSRLPDEFTSNSEYLRIFGKTILDVVPPDPSERDAHFVSKDKVHGYQISFILRGSNLVIRAKLDDRRFVLIPSDKFHGDIPDDLVTDCIPWLDLQDGTIEFRPLQSLWRYSQSNWNIDFRQHRRMKREECTGSVVCMVDRHSPTGRMITSRLEPLETPGNLIIITSERHRPSTYLSRYRLTFALNDANQLQCQTYPGMVVDDDQSAGFLIGLRNQLVLKEVMGSKRTVIVPVGNVEFKHGAFHKWHTLVTIHCDEGRRVKFYRYHVDPVLGRLTGAFDLHSRLYLIYLEAVTSHCLPNPLTLRTGTERSLLELRSAACRSFQRLDGQSRELLQCLSALTPRRRFTLKGSKGIQSVMWNSLPPSAQHFGFAEACREILEFARKLEVFVTDGSATGAMSSNSETRSELSNRAAARLSPYYSSEFWALSPDREYRSRAEVTGSEMEQVICRNSRIITSPLYHNQREPGDETLLDVIGQWPDMYGTELIKATALTYSRDWTSQPLPHVFLSLYNVLRRTTPNPYQISFALCPMTYGPDEERETVRRLFKHLVAFARTDHFASAAFNPPIVLCHSSTIDGGFAPARSHLVRVASAEVKPVDQYVVKYPRRGRRSRLAELQHREEEYNNTVQNEADIVADTVIAQWPSIPTAHTINPDDRQFSVLQLGQFLDALDPYFQQWTVNRDFASRIQTQLNEITSHIAHLSPGPYPAQQYPPSISRPVLHLSLTKLFSERSAPTFFPDDLPPLTPAPSPVSSITHHDLHHDLQGVRELARESVSRGGAHALYAQRLLESIIAHEEEIREETSVNRPIQYFWQPSSPGITDVDQMLEFVLLEYHQTCEESVGRIVLSLERASSPMDKVEGALRESGLWPSLTRLSLLHSLAAVSGCSLPLPWEEALRYLAKSLILYQRAQRLLDMWRGRKFDDFWKEMNVSDCGLNVRENDWLLIQIDNDFLMREVQRDVALEMIRPQSGANTVLQLNMGEGKSSVIIPLVGTKLADGQKLVRIVVLRSLSGAMFSLLVQRLGGLANRQILYMPFCRDVDIMKGRAQGIRELFEDALRSRAIIVAQPEHILSFKLMAVDHLLRQSQVSEVRCFVETQLWLDKHSRDVQDESDEILRTDYELNYTQGLQTLVEDNPTRWMTSQTVLHLLQLHLKEHVNRTGRSTVFDGLDVKFGDDISGFPRLYFAGPQAAHTLVIALTERVLAGDIPECFCPSHYPVRLRDVIVNFIRGSSIDLHAEQEIRAFVGTSWKTILLLRGLLGQGLLAHVLTKRWRVDYGLDLSRSLLAIPYRAKDVPSLRSEFGHPDVAVLLTSLSYLHGGLSHRDVISAFEELFKLDDPTQEYEKWALTSCSNLPTEFRSIAGVNLKDPRQTETQLFTYFRYNPSTISFYLSRVIFPRAAKGFPHKLTTTGWDLACEKAHVTTGFSGTNDNCYLLPASIQQDTSRARLSTNAQMLDVLLKRENSRYLCPEIRVLSPYDIIDAIVGDDTIRAVLDVGALVVEVSNLELVKYWLSRKSDVQAAIYFDRDDVLQVVTRDGLVEPLTMSPFYQQLDRCLVYLDDVHTRGTDLKLPTNWRACVTLGPKVTKDRLVQGCMRMRKLGNGQSVMFIAPRNIDLAIRQLAGKSPESVVTSIDVLRWAMNETCTEIVHRVHLWARQGVDFASRDAAWAELSSSVNPFSCTIHDSLKRSWLQSEARPLEVMYGQENGDMEMLQRIRSNELIWSRCQTLGVTSVTDSRIDEEQEREVNNEVEREPERELPPVAKPATPHLHPHVELFIRTGTVLNDSPAFSSAFIPVRNSAQHSAQQIWVPFSYDQRPIIASKDFLETTKDGTTGDYLRPVNWIISSRVHDILVILSPYEIDLLLPRIRKSQKVRLHLYTPRTTQLMRPTDDLNLYHIVPRPSWTPLFSTATVDQLNLCAGQLYFTNYAAYQRTWDTLRIGNQDQGLDEVERSRLKYLKTLVGFRRKGLPFDSTPLGKTLKALPLPSGAFESG
ncbi:hypothetical protein V5O48_005205 [Marasmius crinis-equi]|uniref:ubiquitinyl hydrolase 1 n=1 Tax=Marasmius crinis-equi TaxID=585013 RepID=A0ABR3FN15_9AGAR